jgi:PAS domain S-box-containing protein
VLDATGGAPRVAGIQMDIKSRKHVEQELRRSRREAQERFRELKALYQNAPVGLALLDLDLRFLRVNEFLAELNGLPVDEHLGRTPFEVAPHLEAGLGPTLMSVLATGEPVRNVEIEAAAGGGEPRAWRFHLHPLRDEAGAVSGIAAVAEDVTERRRTERSRDLLSRELSHRIKNLFAVVSSLISLSARGDDRLQEFSRTIRGRVEALGRAHDTVRPVEWGSDRGDAPTLHKLLRTLLAPYRDEDDRRIRIHGCDPVVGPTAATAMGLAIHEFATNAVKYGGLSAPFGHVDIACGEAGDEVEIAWSEHGGPPVEGPPQREGFGSTLARRSLGGDLNAIIVTDWAREGLVVRIRLPRERLAR